MVDALGVLDFKRGFVGTATAAGSQSGAFGGSDVFEKLDILAERWATGARGPAIYTGCYHAEEELAVKCAVAILNGVPK